ncbi:PilN domain-containing protein [Alkalihalobacillus pseudalcaliphilus]|uniref:PilN domain-containing protein n=1 Tax=Alkalihalobacillus pseudalcaliphilus TaxID=79884 RepID=UPI00064D937C|nr:hypothetical protein [Alkalihalobacillus pseudalcaliphilus]KMK74661.1 hypothetical protein AB990_19390 [Alkalihalobacillus pseudalcaliphilus]
MIEINLLPEKYKRDMTIVFILFLLAVYVLFIFWFTSFQQKLVEAKVTDFEIQIQQTKIEVEMLSAELSSSHVSAEEKWATAVGRLEQEIPYIPSALQEIVKQLPRDVTLTNLTWNTADSVILTIEVATMEEAASFLHHLLEVSFVESAWLTQMDEQEEVLSAQLFIELQSSSLEKIGEGS